MPSMVTWRVTDHLWKLLPWQQVPRAACQELTAQTGHPGHHDQRPHPSWSPRTLPSPRSASRRATVLKDAERTFQHPPPLNNQLWNCRKAPGVDLPLVPQANPGGQRVPGAAALGGLEGSTWTGRGTISLKATGASSPKSSGLTLVSLQRSSGCCAGDSGMRDAHRGQLPTPLPWRMQPELQGPPTRVPSSLTVPSH